MHNELHPSEGFEFSFFCSFIFLSFIISYKTIESIKILLWLLSKINSLKCQFIAHKFFFFFAWGASLWFIIQFPKVQLYRESRILLAICLVLSTVTLLTLSLIILTHHGIIIISSSLCIT